MSSNDCRITVAELVGAVVGTFACTVLVASVLCAIVLNTARNLRNSRQRRPQGNSLDS